MAPLITDALIAEYQTIVSTLHDRDDSAAVVSALVEDADWTPQGAAIVADLARAYGTSVLRNALALAAALDIEDGELGL